MILIRDLVVTRPKAVLLRIAQLNVAEGERVCIEGPNGSGKSTLLRVLAGLESEFRGTVSIEAQPKERTLVHQDPFLFRGSVLSNVLFGLRSKGLGRRESHRIATAWLERTGLDTLAQRRCAGLSGGERRRVALARAFALDPKLLLLDEPLSDLDDRGAKMLADILSESPAVTVLMTSPKGEATSLAQRTVNLAPPGTLQPSIR